MSAVDVADPNQVGTSGPRRKSARYESLDIWRGLACLMIVVGHASKTITNEQWTAPESGRAGFVLWKIAANLYIGVPLFFVISGYCIAATAESTSRAGAGALTYFTRRFRRIFPPYWIAALLSLAVVVVAIRFGFGELLTRGDDNFPRPSSVSFIQWLGSASLTETWRYHVVGASSPRLLFFGPSWTLCYEEQFYAVCGLLLAFGPRRFWTNALGVSVATIVIAALASRYGISIDGFFFDGRWLIFAAGLVAFFALNHSTTKGRRAVVALLAVAFAMGLVVRYRVMRSPTFDGEQKLLVFEIVIGIAFAIVLAVLRPFDARLARSRVLRPLAWCGEMCFSLYLIHWPVTVLVSHALDAMGVQGLWPVLFVTVPVATGASVVLARVFHRFVERRFQNQPMKDGVAAARAPIVVAATATDDRTAS